MPPPDSNDSEYPNPTCSQKTKPPTAVIKTRATPTPIARPVPRPCDRGAGEVGVGEASDTCEVYVRLRLKPLSEALVGPFATETHLCGLGNDHQIQGRRPMLDVVQVHAHALVPVHFLAAGDLP